MHCFLPVVRPSSKVKDCTFSKRCENIFDIHIRFQCRDELAISNVGESSFGSACLCSTNKETANASCQIMRVSLSLPSIATREFAVSNLVNAMFLAGQCCGQTNITPHYRTGSFLYSRRLSRSQWQLDWFSPTLYIRTIYNRIDTCTGIR